MNLACFLTLSYTGGGGGGGGEHKVPALISKIRNFATNTATATKIGNFSLNVSGKTIVG